MGKYIKIKKLCIFLLLNIMLFAMLFYSYNIDRFTLTNEVIAANASSKSSSSKSGNSSSSSSSKTSQNAKTSSSASNKTSDESKKDASDKEEASSSIKDENKLGNDDINLLARLINRRS